DDLTDQSANLRQSIRPGSRLPIVSDEDQCNEDKARSLPISVGPRLWTTLSGVESLPPSQTHQYTTRNLEPPSLLPAHVRSLTTCTPSTLALPPPPSSSLAVA